MTKIELSYKISGLSDSNNITSYNELIKNMNEINRLVSKEIEEDFMDDGEESDG